MRCPWLLALPFVFPAAIAHAEDRKTEAVGLVTFREGKLPIILSAPHGGQSELPGVPSRRGEGLPRGSGFFTARDVNTDQLALALADAVERKMGHRPHLIVARFSRKYTDANRPPEVAYEDPKARPVYDAYHGALSDACKEVKKSHGRDLLLDLHGQARRATPSSAVPGMARRSRC